VEGDVYAVSISEEENAIQGLAVLNFPDSDRERVMTRLQSMESGRYLFQESVRLEPDKRNYPRLYAGLQVTYRVPADADAPWSETDEYMNFSVSGLAFDGTGCVPNGSPVELKVSLAGEDKEWMVTGRVIRCDELAPPERQTLNSGAETTCSLAVAFTFMAPDCREALESLTLRMLDV